MQVKQPLHFFDLLREIPNRFYEQCLVSGEKTRRQQRLKRQRLRLVPDNLSANRQINKEVTSMLYGVDTFLVDISASWTCKGPCGICRVLRSPHVCEGCSIDHALAPKSRLQQAAIELQMPADGGEPLCSLDPKTACLSAFVQFLPVEGGRACLGSDQEKLQPRPMPVFIYFNKLFRVHWSWILLSSISGSQGSSTRKIARSTVLVVFVPTCVIAMLSLEDGKSERVYGERSTG